MPSNNPHKISSRNDYEAMAKQANLRYVSDDEPGYTRKPWGRGFTYQDADGNTINDTKLRNRFEALVIPPMWQDVWICEYENGHIQCTGRDEKGRKQYLYHKLWSDISNQIKYDAVIRFGESLPALRAQVNKDLNSDLLSRANVLATVIKLLETTLIRVGNKHYAQNNKSYGLSTLRSKHVTETADGLAFDFMGKSAKEHHIELHDERLIKIINACSDLPGYRIFKYVDAEGQKQLVESQDINAYLKQHTGHEFSAKDFRTWMASVLAASYLYSNADKDVIKSEPDSQLRNNLVVNMVKFVAKELGNTPSVCRDSYIHPKIIDSFLNAQFIENYKNAREGRTQKNQTTDERALLAFLKSTKN